MQYLSSGIITEEYINTMKKYAKTIIITAVIAVLASAFIFLRKGDTTTTDTVANETATSDTIQPAPPVTKYGLPIEEFIVTYDTIERNETLAEVLYGFGFNAQQIHSLTQCPDTIFDEKKIRPGEACALLCDNDSTALYFIYETSPKSYVTFDIAGGMIATRHEKPSEWLQREVAGRVNSSLWVAMEESNASPQLAVLMSHIFGWSIDFFGIQKGDEFRLVYSQEHVEGNPINNYRIDAASFCASGNTVYAIPFTQGDEELYYNIDGNSLEGAFLKAPLDYYRISSKFSNSRYHPVLKRHRAHHGVDYAAPKGTPVYAIGSGKVIKKAYQANGAGYYLKIRHNSTYTTSYMHLSGYAKGLKEGDYVKQKQVIGYVGSTGLSTGPHLDFRVYENGNPINPLTIKSQPKMPISEANKVAFDAIKDSIVIRLDGIPISNTTQSTEKEIVAEP